VELGIGKAHVSGATPMDPDEIDGLIPQHITMKRELDEYEQANILSAQEWADRRIRKDVLNEKFVRDLHRRMFNKTWKWAGQFRKTEKSIGVDPLYISIELRKLLDDAQYWQQFGTYPIDEQACRLHHRMVFIHLFANGNGRHARLMTDVFLRSCGAQPFSWGQINMTNPAQTRKAYISALQAADGKNYGLLRGFVRS